ncbi:hypothetical protein RRG08_004607 [Elysia crispata]|uniref:ATP-dependent DNA helicase n=1 Tax=Elysia crispata TaxID=231223 RepID=A0AAE1AMM1_9GAST|nr:hypothetical protein RRG08_004607 [Elysia crispata]
MQDIRKHSSPFGGPTVLLDGDWRQILPVVRHGSRPDIVEATLKSSYLWQTVTRLQLTQNMRAKLRLRLRTFEGFLEGNSTACTPRPRPLELPPVGPREPELLTPISWSRSPIRHLGTRWVGDGRPVFNSPIGTQIIPSYGKQRQTTTSNIPRNLLTVDLRSRQRSDDGTPESGRLNRRIGEELSTTTSTNKRDDGEKPDGVTVENHGTRLGKKLKVGTWNVRTLDAGKVEIIENEMERIKLNILGICEHRWKGQGHLTTPKGGKFIYSGREQPGQSGVGILLEKETAKSLIGYNPISDRILIVRIQGRKKNMALIQAYAPTSSSEIEEAEEFYAALQHTQTGLLDGKTKNQIDYILVKKRWKSSIQQTKTYPGTDCGTDHELLVSTIKIKLRKIKKPEPPVRFDLTQILEEYGIEIKNKFGMLMAVEEEMGPDELATHAQQILLTTAKNRIPKRKAKRQPWISNTTLELIEERRNLKAGQDTI